MKRVKSCFYLYLTEFRYCQFLKEMGINISFEKDELPGVRRIKRHEVINKLGLSYTILSIKHSIAAQYIFFKPLRRISEVDYFSLVYEEFKDQIDNLISFSANKVQKRFFQFVKSLEQLESTNYQNQLTFPSK